MISTDDLATFGAERLVYVKRIVFCGRDMYSAHGADGTHLSVFADRAAADSALRQHEFEPLSVH
jgi:hypothetical protein